MTDSVQLRRKAESKSLPNDYDFDLSEFSIEQLQSLMHELKVHQIELEMQNDELQNTQANLTHSKEQYQALFDFAPIGYLTVDSRGLIQNVNLTVSHMLLEDKDVLSNKSLYNYIDSEYQILFTHHLHRIIKHQKPFQYETNIQRTDGSFFHALIRGSLFYEPNIEENSIRIVITDIDEIYKLRYHEKLAAQVIESSIEGILIVDSNGKIISVNKKFEQVTGYSIKDAVGENASILSSGKHDRVFYEKMWSDVTTNGSWEGSIWNRRKNGEIYQEWLHIFSIKDADGRHSCYVGKFTDLSDTKEAQTRLHYLAHYDLLTELPNRTLFIERLEQSIFGAERSEQKVVVFFMDLDGFKSINDSLGHEFGDKLLQHVAKRLNDTVRKNDTVSRLGGDEFTIIANNIDNTDQIITMAEKVLSAFNRPFIIDKRRVFSSTSIGISIYPDDGVCGSDLIRFSDTAMYHAKEQGRNQFSFYTEKMGSIANKRMELEHDLRAAIEQEQLTIHYQPQYDISSGEITGLEALVRWHHPQQGLIFPGYFIPEAEKTNLILAIGEWVINNVCKQAATWLMEGKKPIRIAINISPKQFHLNNFEEQIKQALTKNNLPGHWIELEITEQSLVRDMSEVIHTLNALKELDISLAIDDFGTGYSSMNYLKKLPVDVLKIDQSFIKDIEIDKANEAIITAIVALAKGLNMVALAEGVETKSQHEFLSKLTCQQGQGFLYNKPMTAQEISHHLS